MIYGGDLFKPGHSWRVWNFNAKRLRLRCKWCNAWQSADTYDQDCEGA